MGEDYIKAVLHIDDGMIHRFREIILMEGG